ncbi:hypothetical protein DDB_G0286973 [Dictyostelium discoideum AX4]|uniref:Right handed beta helix domain-containing protein n=1 Tax=Dictyostelium discoideum TaxID=44689 RepID=Q54L18_DICDI|nr:hypothetical protein DDB_G0286973 [Dictyostelium discoideum AX4]EAL63984.1 hypothetical protein DDB_G0286973 [Dictyostelium discoideum AX4]|eukprot:XP_637485.1 hypothetical protein DDB_G0286973 [Dictyostelium discoideum AX4]
MKKNNYLLFFLIIIINFLIGFVNCQVCNTFVNSDSNSDSNDCGTSDNPCSTISQSISNCGQFSEMLMTISPGYYNVEKTTFGEITNKTISIINSASPDIIAPNVFLDLTELIDPFINIQIKSNLDVNNITFYGITFKNGLSDGSVVLVNGSSLINLSVTKCSFYRNAAYHVGGTFAFLKNNLPLPSPSSTKNSTVSIIQSTFNNTKLVNAVGGIIYSDGIPIIFTIEDSNILNFVSNDIGSILMINNGFLSISNTIITGGSSNNSIYLIKTNNNNNTSTTTPSIPVFKFSNVNVTDTYGGIVIQISGDSSATSSFSSCNFVNTLNTLPILLKNGGQSVIDSCSFENNNINNYINNVGGAITLLNNQATINNCTFTNNHAQNGGAIYIDQCGTNQSSNYLTISNTIFNENFAKNGLGGSIYNLNCTISINNVKFIDNKIDGSPLINGNGSNIFCGSSNITINSTVFLNVQKTSDYNNYGINCLSDKNSCNIKFNINNNNNNNNNNKFENVQCSSSTSQPTSKGNSPHVLTKAEKIGISLGVIGAVIIISVVVVLIARKIKRDSQYKPIGLH